MSPATPSGGTSAATPAAGSNVAGETAAAQPANAQTPTGVLGENVSRGTTGSAALPRTGQDFNWLAIAAITLMTLGAGFVLFGRRRTASHPTV